MKRVKNLCTWAWPAAAGVMLVPPKSCSKAVAVAAMLFGCVTNMLHHLRLLLPNVKVDNKCLEGNGQWEVVSFVNSIIRGQGG